MDNLINFIIGLNFGERFAIVIIFYEIVSCFYHNRKSLVFVITRDFPLVRKPNYIGMLPTVLAIPCFLYTGRERFFINQLKILLDSLKINTTYTAETHDTIIRQIKHQERLGEIEILELTEIEKNNKKKKRFLFLEKIQLLNFSNLLEKKQEYRISFRKKSRLPIKANAPIT